jgi:hypothetical protein
VEVNQGFPCKHSQVYTGRTSWFTETRAKELCQLYKVAVTENSITASITCNIRISKLSSPMLDMGTTFLKEATETELCPKNINRKDGLALRSQKPLIHSWNEQRQPDPNHITESPFLTSK